MRALLGIAGVELKRFIRDKGNVFVVFVLPLMLVLVIGSQFGDSGGSGGSITISGANSDLRTDLVAELEDAGLSVESADHETMLEQVARGRTDAGIALDDEAATAYTAAQQVEIAVVAGSAASGTAAAEQIRVAVAALDLRAAQLGALQEAGLSEPDAEAAVQKATQSASAVQVVVTDVDRIAQEFRGLGQFDLGAATQLLLFTFLTSLAGSSSLISTRRLGVLARTLAAPVGTLRVVAGQALGRWVIALVQSAYIMLASWLLFDVNWGNLALALLILGTFALVAAGAAMVLGSVLDTEGAAVGAGVGVGLVLATLGGGMAPLEVFSGPMRDIAHLTPHAWGYDAFARIQRHDGTLIDILPMLGVLLGMAAVLLAAGSWLLRRSMARAI